MLRYLLFKSIQFSAAKSYRSRRAKHVIERACGNTLRYDRLSQKPIRTNSAHELEKFAKQLERQALTKPVLLKQRYHPAKYPEWLKRLR